jgi:hypothetical protein
MIEDIIFIFKLFTTIKIGKPPQKIEAFFDIKLSTFFIINTCKDCLSFYSYKYSDSFYKIVIEEKPYLYGSTFYVNEIFYFYDENDNKKEIKYMLIFLLELKDNNKITNCLYISLKFPDYWNNNFQESFIQQLKHKNIIIYFNLNLNKS